MKISTIIGSIVLLIATTGCAGAFGEKKVDPNYELLMNTLREIEIGKSAARISEANAKATIMTALANKCNDSNCISQLAMTNSLNSAMEAIQNNASGGNTASQLPVYQKQRSGWASAADWVLRLAGIAVPEWRADRQGKYSLQSSIAQYQFLGGVVNGVTDAAVAMQPNITVEGVYNTGEYTEIAGGYIGGDVSGPGAGIGNAFWLDNSTPVSGNNNTIGDGNAQDNSQGQINGNNARLDSDDNIDASDRRNCIAGSGAEGGTATSTTGSPAAGNGAPGGSANCSGG